MSQTITNSLQVVSFWLINQSNGKKEDYAIPIEHVREIRNLEEITEIPKAKSYVKGIMNLRGIIIPVFDIKDKLGFGKTDLNQSNQKILVTEINENLYGLLIDEVDQVMRIPQKDIEKSPQETFNSSTYVKGIAKTPTKLLVILDILNLLENQKSSNNIKKDYCDSDNPPIKLDEAESPSLQNDGKSSDSTESNFEDNIPPELKEVFEEDSREKLSSENTKNSNESINMDQLKKDNSDKFQSRVKRETNRIQNDSP